MDSNGRDALPLTKQWSCGVLDGIEANEVPGTVLLFPEYAFKDTTAFEEQHGIERNDEKRTMDGVVLSPQPEETPNDPLNFPIWRRNAALLALGLYCMLGGGMAPLLATGFPNVADTYHVTVPQVALTTGLYMLGLGIGSVFLMPTAIIFGKRPVYLLTAVCFIATSIWCAMSPSYNSLLLARIAQGIAISPVECLASSTVTELFFLHERAFRLGIYTLLLLSGKNLFPLLSAEIIQALSWRSVFWIVAAIGAFCIILLTLFLPETFWDRSTPPPVTGDVASLQEYPQPIIIKETEVQGSTETVNIVSIEDSSHPSGLSLVTVSTSIISKNIDARLPPQTVQTLAFTAPLSPRLISQRPGSTFDITESKTTIEQHEYAFTASPNSSPSTLNSASRYTEYWRLAPPKSYVQSLSLFPGRLSDTPYHLILLRPFILFAYPSIIWSSLIYACSVGWLIVLSESISALYRNRDTYNFTAFQTGLVYISAFVGGVLGTAIAGKCSDFVVKFMAKRNAGVYEPEFRLVMIIPVAVCSVAGLIGFGWSIEERDAWIVPTVFFGLISFGCSLGSTVAISFAVDCYREFAGEALVTMNFSKNILHGLVFSLFFPEWLEAKGSKNVFVAIGIIQLVCLLFTIPMFIYGKRARMWVAKKDMMQKFR